ncbi:alpha/beta fold hydrolase [Salinibacterium sp. ZJ70]|uniref:alpha/beta fold hydrolase n=1 Tax=Salinibacterium sp. ZJ70 TaxID=2708084 RepID=UPI0014203E11|nr:alpha/beta fold hydrolase [Salinibacterium sp. ZJ70]
MTDFTVFPTLDPVGSTWTDADRRINYIDTVAGDRGTVLLIAGLGMQRIEWQPEFAAELVRRGYRVISADNRDCGLSNVAGDEYEIRDMALDLVDLLRHLGVENAHVLGISMGGMIAQHVAMAAPEITASLTSLMSTTGRRGVGRPHEVSKWIFRTDAPSENLDEFLDYAIRHHESIAGPHYVELEFARETALRAFERGLRPAGTARQLAAIQADGDRHERLGAITVPTLVVHGDADPMIDVSGGEDTAAAIPGSRLELLPNVGHTIPVAVVPQLVDVLTEHFAAAS